MATIDVSESAQPDIKVMTDIVASMTRLLGKLSEHVSRKHAELGVAEWTILRHVSETPGIRAGQLVRRLQISGQRVNQLVNSLRKAGLVETRVPPSEARVREISITPAGTAKLADIDKDVSGIFNTAFAGRPQALIQLRGRVRRLAQVASEVEDG